MRPGLKSVAQMLEPADEIKLRDHVPPCIGIGKKGSQRRVSRRFDGGDLAKDDLVKEPPVFV